MHTFSIHSLQALFQPFGGKYFQIIYAKMNKAEAQLSFSIEFQSFLKGQQRAPIYH